MNPIGFVLITHSNPHQIKRLVERLNSMFDSPPIVIHHDFGKCPLPEDFLPGNVSFVRPYVNTSWGTYSIVEATLLGFAQMYRQANAPEWCVLLSGADYPTKPAKQILEDLTTGGHEAYIQYALINLASLSEPSENPPDPLDNLTFDWYRERYRRYCIKKLVIPSVDKRLRPKKRVIALPAFIGNPLVPFSAKFQCYSGGHWFTASRRAAQYLLDFQKTPQNMALSNHYLKLVPFPEESYFQTVFCNAPDLKVSYYNLRYIDWTEHWLKRTGHPKLLTMSNLEAMQASSTHFARKIDSDADLLDALDQIIDANKVVFS